MHESEAGAHGKAKKRRLDDGVPHRHRQRRAINPQRGGQRIQGFGADRRQRRRQGARKTVRVEDEEGDPAVTARDARPPLRIMGFPGAGARQPDASGVAVHHQPARNGGDPGDDAAVILRPARVDGDHMAGGGIADRSKTVFNQRLHHPAVGRPGAPEQHVLADVVFAPDRIAAGATGGDNHRARPDPLAGRGLRLPAVQGLRQSNRFAVIVKTDAEARRGFIQSIRPWPCRRRAGRRCAANRAARPHRALAGGRRNPSANPRRPPTPRPANAPAPRPGSPVFLSSDKNSAAE